MASCGAKWPVLLVPCNGGSDFHPVHFHVLRDDGYYNAPEAQRLRPGQQRALPFLHLLHHPRTHRSLGGLFVERQDLEKKIPGGYLRPRAVGFLYFTHEGPALEPRAMASVLQCSRRDILLTTQYIISFCAKVFSGCAKDCTYFFWINNSSKR